MSITQHESRVGARSRARWSRLCLLAAVSGVGCSNGEPVHAVSMRYALERVASCEDAEHVIRARALEDMNTRIDQLKASPRLSWACPPPTPTYYPTAYASSSSYGPSPSQGSAQPITPTPSTPPSSARPAMASAPAQAASAPMTSSGNAPAAATPTPAAPATDANAASANAKSASTTNNQVFGVDEADFIKNDSKYVYAALNGALRIIDAWPAEQAHEIAHVALPGQPKKLFVTGDRALVYLSVPRTAAANPSAPGASATFYYAPTTECTYAYDCDFAGDGSATLVLIFDISDRAQPKQIRRLELSGSLLAARRIGPAVHTVMVTPEVKFTGLSYSVAGAPTCGVAITREESDAQYEALRQRNAEIIENTPLRQLIPTLREEGADYADEICGAMYRESSQSGTAFTSVVSLDMVDDGRPTVSTIVSKPGAVYASGEALYMGVNYAVPSQTTLPAGAAYSSANLSMAIHKFRIGATPESYYLASGHVKGHVLNQFSMDEYDGHLRVATSWGKVPNPDVHSTLSVLEQNAGELNTVGIVDEIAPHEDIRSVRFEGDRGFVVTFKKTDPLYTFDLSKPTKPRIAGELKIPGFSTYMHFLDPTHLLTIGYDAADQGSFAYFTGVLLQIFDVTDLSNPTLAHKTVIGTRGSSSEALTNHLAFNLWNDKLAVPMTICEGGGTNGMYGTNMTFSGLIVYDVSVQDGLAERGRVAHPGPNGMYTANCNNWWTNASSVVERSIFMDDYVYSVARNIMRVQDLNAMGTDVSSVSFVP